MPITPLPPVMQSTDPAGTYADKGDAWTKALSDVWTPEANALEENVNAKESYIMGQAEIVTEAGAEQVTLATEQAILAASQAAIAESQADIAASYANSKGSWDELTGSFNAGISVYHSNLNWQLLKDIGDISSVEPGTNSSFWAEIRLRSQIETPVVTYPTNGTNNLGSSINVTGTTYRSLYGYDQSDAQIQISEIQDFSTTVIDTIIGNAVSTFPITGLTILTTYYCRIRYQDSVDRWSTWSTSVLFTTAGVYIDTPTNVSPVNLETNIDETPTLTSDAFECINGTDTHLNSDWEVYSDSGLTIKVWSSYTDAANLTTAVVPAGILNPGSTNYYWRCKHTGTTYGASPWSNATKFTTKDQYDLIYGIAMVSPGGGAGTWQRVNKNGNNIELGVTEFNNHPVWGSIETVVIDGQSMVKIPKFYIKVGTLPGGDQVGKKAWLIADHPVDGYSLHPAFMDGGVEIDQFYYGAYEATDDSGIKAGSTANIQPLVSIDFPTMQARCNARNTGEVDGFHMVNIHELSAVQVLCLIENGGPDVQSTIGQGNVSSSAAVNTGASNAVWRGIYELWGNTRCMIDGAQFDTSNQIKIFDQNGNNTYVATGVNMAASSGWITGMHDDAGSGYDIGMMFLGKTMDSTEGNGTFGDYQQAPNTNDNVCYHGGYWSLGSRAGLFSLRLDHDASFTSTNYGSRLAKV